MADPFFPLWYWNCKVCGCELTVLNRSRIRDVCKSCLKRKVVPVSV